MLLHHPGHLDGLGAADATSKKHAPYGVHETDGEVRRQGLSLMEEVSKLLEWGGAISHGVAELQRNKPSTVHRGNRDGLHGTDLELILRARGIDTVIATHVCCDPTVREANARDFRVLFLSDGTTTGGNRNATAAELQKATLVTLGAVFAQVLVVDEVVQKIGAAACSGAA